MTACADKRRALVRWLAMMGKKTHLDKDIQAVTDRMTASVDAVVEKSITKQIAEWRAMRK